MRNYVLEGDRLKRKILFVLFIVISIMITVHFLPAFQGVFNLFNNSNAAAIGIIGGVDGPTAIYIESQINWFPIVIILIWLILGIYLIYTHSKR